MPRLRRWATGWLAITLVLGCGGCGALLEMAQDAGADAASDPGRGSETFVTWLTITGGNFGGDLTPAGKLEKSGGPAYVHFVFPLAVAARGADVYIADAGLGKLFRYDLSAHTLFAFSGARAEAGVRLQVGLDRSVYVLDSRGRRVQRFNRDGRLLQVHEDDGNLGEPADLALDTETGEVLVADSLFNRLLAYRPAGRFSRLVLPKGEPLGKVTGLAVGPDGFYVLDSGTRRIVVMDRLGGILYILGQGDLVDPVEIAADRGNRTYALERRTNTIKVFAGRRLAAEIAGTPVPAGPWAIRDIATDESFLYLANGPGARIEVLRIMRGPRAP